MCGIAGFIDNNSSREDLLSLIKVLKHRGPDHEQVFFEDGLGLAHQRLSVIDLDARANQPFVFKNLILTYNGEIYNFQELRDKLKGKGYTFKTTSDTEVLIKAYHCWGEGAIDKFHGMFAFALYDRESKEMILCRDRIGVKPLYYLNQGNSLFFASELKAFKHFFPDLSMSKTGLYKYLRYGYIPGTDTIFNNVYKLQPGSFLKFKNNKPLQIKKYWEPENYINDKLSLPESTVVDLLEENLIEAFKYRMISDVPAGIFLSGGVDSSLLAAILQKHYGDISTFTIGFDQPDFNEAPYAKQIAEFLKLNHHERIISVNEGKDLFNNFYDVYDEPFYDTSGIPTSLVTKLAKDNGMKVVLSADGGDELFCGYPSYIRANNIWKKIKRIPYGIRSKIGGGLYSLAVSPAFEVNYLNINHRIKKLSELMEAEEFASAYESLISTKSSRELKEYINEFDENLDNLINPSYPPSTDPLDQMMLWDLKFFLPDDLLMKVDRATMFHSVESREPFLDHRLVELALKIPASLKIKDGETKYLLKEVLKRYLPKDFFIRKKQGFNVPLNAWFTEHLNNGFSHKLNGQNLTGQIPLLNAQHVNKDLKKFNYYQKNNKDYNLLHIFKLASILMWHEKYNKE